MSFLSKLAFWKHKEESPFPPIGGGPPSLESLFPTGLGGQADRQFGAGFESTFGTGVPPAPGSGSQGQFPSLQREPMVSPIIQPQPYQPVTQSPKEFEAVNSKLDNIKAMLENLSLRLEKIERPLFESQKPLEKEFARKQSEWRY
ncbi:hypothetical protein HY641_01585 [Candidatus Woesearchaeota archaeon]|nr:hypothetical protein [Candidatus Woesearchaeota archaeon]